jgi:hypothetical protein
MTGWRWLWVPTVLLLAGACLFCGENKGGGPGGGIALFEVELEHYFGSFDAPASQMSIRNERCSSASNDSSATGLDVSGEWIMVMVDVPESGSYVAHLSYASEPGDVIAVSMEIEDCGSATTAEFLLSEGSGTS